MQDIQISDATREDMKVLMSMLERASLPLAGVSPESTDFLVARQQGAVVGGVGMETYGSMLLLRSLVVSPGRQHQGVGQELVKAFLARARAEQKARVYLLTLDCQAFFRKFGFQEIPTELMPQDVRASQQFDGCCGAKASSMVLSLTDADREARQKEDIQRKYGQVAQGVLGASKSSCCGPRPQKTQVTRDLYTQEQAACLPSNAKSASRGCGSPTDLLKLKPGETVLDLGSGAGVDVFLAAQQVGPTGKVYGLDVTPEMLELARQGQKELGLQNVEFIQGEMEKIPLAARSVDAVVSNCVISLVKDKDHVFREIFRVMKPNGRLSVSDIVSTNALPATIREDLNLWLGCLGGALLIEEYQRKLERAGFTEISIEIKRVYDLEELLTREVDQGGRDSRQTVAAIKAWGGQVCSAAVTARRPSESPLHLPLPPQDVAAQV